MRCDIIWAEVSDMAKTLARFKGDIGQVTDDVVEEILRTSDTAEREERQDTDGILLR